MIWLRVDPEMLWLSKTSIEMPDYMWQAMLLHERDVVYQHMAAEVYEPYSLRFGGRGASIHISILIKFCGKISLFCSLSHGAVDLARYQILIQAWNPQNQQLPLH